MYCPGCATQNHDDAKFCRVCGTNLETVALALSGQDSHMSKRGDSSGRLSKDKRDYRRHAVNKLIEGTGLIVGSTLVGAALAIFSGKPDWIIIWMVFGAWLAVLGILSIGKGISSLIEWKYSSRELETSKEYSEMLPPSDFKDIAAPITSPKLTPIPSVTENTTKLLDEAKIQNGK